VLGLWCILYYGASLALLLAGRHDDDLAAGALGAVSAHGRLDPHCAVLAAGTQGIAGGALDRAKLGPAAGLARLISVRAHRLQVVTATKWQIQASALIGLPWKLVCTYDILAMEQYNTTTFNGVLHLAAMRAVEELSKVVNDTATAAIASAAFSYGQASMQSLLWNSTYGYYRAYTGGDAIMVCFTTSVVLQSVAC
jgi:hypothetical protein